MRPTYSLGGVYPRVSGKKYDILESDWTVPTEDRLCSVGGHYGWSSAGHGPSTPPACSQKGLESPWSSLAVSLPGVGGVPTVRLGPRPVPPPGPVVPVTHPA